MRTGQTPRTGRTMRAGRTPFPIFLVCVSSIFLDGVSSVISLSTGPKNQPYFDPITATEVTALQNETVRLHCYVRQRGNKTVSWLRARDLHVLSVGEYTYATDLRFSSIYEKTTEDWSLEILDASPLDSGIYECQISTNPITKIMVHLSVLAPETELIGPTEMYVEKESTLNLTCIVRNTLNPPANIQWFHNQEEINYDSPRGGVSVVTEKGLTGTRSSLILLEATPKDSGNFSCLPAWGDPASLYLHVLHGQQSAGWQHNGSSGSWVKRACFFPSMAFLFIVSISPS